MLCYYSWSTTPSTRYILLHWWRPDKEGEDVFCRKIQVAVYRNHHVRQSLRSVVPFYWHRYIVTDNVQKKYVSSLHIIFQLSCEKAERERQGAKLDASVSSTDVSKNIARKKGRGEIQSARSTGNTWGVHVPLLPWVEKRHIQHNKLCPDRLQIK